MVELFYRRRDEFLIVLSGLLLPVLILVPTDLILIFAVHISGTLAELTHILFAVLAVVHYVIHGRGPLEWLRERLEYPAGEDAP